MLVALEGSSLTTFGENNYKYYVWKAYQSSSRSTSLYIEGPAAISWEPSLVNIRKMANEATRFIKNSTGLPFLVGWSRGAAACIQVALDLKRENHKKNIEAMFLFDAVDQDGSTGDFLNYIPGNVEKTYHAMATKKDGIDGILFPTCGKTAARPGILVKKEFNTTHGGIVGADPDNPDCGSKAWMWNHMNNHGLFQNFPADNTVEGGGTGQMAF